MSFLYVFALFCLMVGNVLRHAFNGNCSDSGGVVVWSCCARASESAELIDIYTFRSPRHHEIEAVGYISDSVQVSTESSVFEQGRVANFAQYMSLP